MPNLSTCKESALSAATLSALEPFRQKGSLADVYLQFANSEVALRAYLQMETALKGGSLNDRELECIKLLVSELTQCQYCLSIHSYKAKLAGITTEDQLLIRQGKQTGDERVDVLIELVQTLFTEPGAIKPALLDRARAANYSDENLVDISLAMSTIFFTNMTNHLNATESTLPDAPSLPND